MLNTCSNIAFFFFFVATSHFLPIHREAPAFVEQATEQQILVTGIKVWLFQLFYNKIIVVTTCCICFYVLNNDCSLIVPILTGCGSSCALPERW
jgi:hypothetical protein